MRKIVILTTIVLLAGSLVAGTYSGGDGSESNPYQIATTADLIELSKTSDDWDKYFIQTADLSFDATEANVDWDNNGSAGPVEGFSPIGILGTNFTGTYDGQNHTIANLYINRPSTGKVGLFGDLVTASILRLGTINVNITGENYVGGLAGNLYDGTIVDSCFSTGSVNAKNKHGGGLIGYGAGSDLADANTVNNSYSTADVQGDYVGGLFGGAGCLVNNCYATGSVTGNSVIPIKVKPNFQKPC